MAMMRALTSGVSGMLANQLAMDVSSNNLANTNTPGFKGSRVNFGNSLVQTLYSGSQPTGSLGGQNPRQVGLGVAAQSIEVDMSQGALQATGRDLDLAIQGDGFFELTDGTRSFYSRVGNFGLDSQNNLVQLSTGKRLIGNTYNLDVAPNGQQTIAQTNIPIDVPVEDAFPPRVTQSVGFQGNLSSDTPALRGSNLQSIYPLINKDSNTAATEDTLLKDLTMFTGSETIPAAPNDVKSMFVYGTRPDGETYAGTFELHPWDSPSTGDNSGTVGELVSKLNEVFNQGSSRFATARIENGNLILTTIGDGNGFSVFIGEGESDYGATDQDMGGGLHVYSMDPAGGADNPINGTAKLDVPLSATTLAISFTNGPGSTSYSDPVAIAEDGLFDVTGLQFTGNVGHSFALTVSRTTAGGTTTQNTYTITGTGAAQNLQLYNLFHVEAGDTVNFSVATDNAGVYTVAGTGRFLNDANPDLTHDINYDFNKPGHIQGSIPIGKAGLIDPHFVIPFPATGALPGATVTLNQALNVSVRINGKEYGAVTIPADTYTNSDVAGRTFRLPSLPHVSAGDLVEYTVVGSVAGTVNVETFFVDDSLTSNMTNDAGTMADGQPNMFQEGGGVDAHAWQYRNETNSTFDWYRARLVPEFISTSIEVFDAQGGEHGLEARFFRVGTRTVEGTGAKINSWDMMINIDQTDGTIVSDIVAGLEFDQTGRFLGQNATIFGTALNDASYRGNPSVQSVEVNWNTTGPSTPATIALDFGEARTHNGLTCFGSKSSAAATTQDGYGDGKLDSLSVSSEGDLVALYTNGINRKLAQIPLVTFRNPEGLTNIEGNLWSQSTASGDPVRRIAGRNAGLVTSGALEGGNVDIATEFTRMITSQRGFQISARIIQTTDKILEEIANLTR